MFTKISPLFILCLVMLVQNQAKADISDAFRRSNAVVLYEFKDTDNTVRDTADPKFGPPLNLTISASSYVSRTVGEIEFKNYSQVRSSTPATKIYDQCKANGELSVEIWLENNEGVEKRSGVDDKGVLQPVRILSYARGLFDRNFTIGEVYKAGDMYAAGISNSSNTMASSLREPIMSSTDAILIRGANPNPMPQKIILTYKKGGQARLYVSDRNGHLYLHKSAVNDFGGDFSNWDRNNSYLTLGNEYVADPTYFTQSTNFDTCDPKTNSVCGKNPNRFWKGKVNLVAIYCKELTQKDVFNGQYEVIQTPVFPVDPNIDITPKLLRAQSIYTRITGVKTPIYNPVLGDMVKKLDANDPVGAAGLATQDPNFYNLTVKDFAAKMSNRDESISVPLNDFIATVVGFTRDEKNAKGLLSENVVYIGDVNKAAVPSSVELDIVKSNNHYEALTASNFDLSKVLVPTVQKMYDGKNVIDNPTPAGLLTTRQWLSAHAIAGTNRRLVEYTLREFLCRPIETVADATGPDNVIGRDIDRFPGGVHSKFVSTCRACHTILDGFRPAYAYFTFSNNMVKHGMVSAKATNSDMEAASAAMETMPDYIPKKLNHNETVFPEGRITENDNWVNNATLGANASTFEWDRTSGTGIKQFGEMIANSKQFPRCMAKRVFATVCKRQPAAIEDTMINDVAKEFSTSHNYNLKWLFQRIVTTSECLGGN